VSFLMIPRNPLAVLAALSVISPLTACDRQPAESAGNATSPATAPAPRELALDESRLPPFMHFSASDLDTSKDPCTDFAGYVNGKWLAANPIPADRSDWGPMAALEERSLAVRRQLAEEAASDPDAEGIEKIVGDFWATGMDEARVNAAGIAPLADRLSAIEALAGADDVVDFLRTSAAHGEAVVIGIGPEADFKDSSMTIAYAAQGGLGLPDRSYYFDADKRDKLTAYQAHVARVLELSGVAADAAAAQARSVIAFETRLAKASLSNQEIARDVSLYYNPVSPADADMLTPHFSWTRFFAAQGVAVPAMFSLGMPAYHQEVDRMIAELPAADWRAYLRFHAVDGASPYLPDPFVQEYFDFYGRTMQGMKETPARWKRVLGAIERSAGEAMGQLYVKVAFPADSKARMETLVGNLTTALEGRIEHLEWMSDATREKALAKLATFRPKIGYPDRWRDYSDLTTTHDSYIDNVLAARAFNHRWQMGRIGKPVDRTEWGMTPQTVNAYYNPLQNELVFPAAILQPPYFDPAADDATNYGSIGAVIGHEMTHGYDDQGSRFGPTGNFENWWTDADAKGFAARTDKLVQQFDAYEALPGLHVNGKLTLGENIADLGGLATAYDAMQAATAGLADPMTDGYSRDQRFFLSFGTVWREQMRPDLLKLIVASNPHAPGQFRAIAPPSNLPAFAEAFSCKPGQPMARSGAERVEIW
jgi:putative endopeptidase